MFYKFQYEMIADTSRISIAILKWHIPFLFLSNFVSASIYFRTLKTAQNWLGLWNWQNIISLLMQLYVQNTVRNAFWFYADLISIFKIRFQIKLKLLCQSFWAWLWHEKQYFLIMIWFNVCEYDSTVTGTKY